MSPTNCHKYKYFHSTVQRAKDRRQKFHFCRLPFDVRPRNVKLNLSNNGSNVTPHHRLAFDEIVFEVMYSISINLLASYHECHPPIGYATNYAVTDS